MTESIPMWLGILLFFIGGTAGLLIMAAFASGSRYDDCKICRYLLFFEKVTRDGKCPDCSGVWLSDLAKGPSASRNK